LDDIGRKWQLQRNWGLARAGSAFFPLFGRFAAGGGPESRCRAFSRIDWLEERRI
jgi:hypothetical protein